MKKYAYFVVATPWCAETFGDYNGDYHDALRFYGKSEKPSTLYGVTEQGKYVCIKSK